MKPGQVFWKSKEEKRMDTWSVGGGCGMELSHVCKLANIEAQSSKMGSKSR